MSTRAAWLPVLAAAALTTAAGRVADHPSPQRVAERVGHERVPEAVREGLRQPAARASGAGATWRVEPDALVQESPAARRLGFADGLPVGSLRAVAVARDGAVWAGGDEGVVRFVDAPHRWDRWQYSAGRRWLPDDRVEAVAADPVEGVWVRTAGGVARLRHQSMTLAEKAARFEARLRERHTRHGLVADSTLRTPGDPASSHQYPNDNDGLWTAIYAAAQCYRYAVTKDADALDRARMAIRAMIRLEAITGRPGFPARSIRQRDEPRHEDGEWHWAEGGEWEWKGDTSSDELVGHFYAFGIAHDLLPDEALKAEIRGVVARMADHLIRHGYYLTDLDGQPTRWGRYGLDYFTTDEGREEQALRATELLSHILVAARVTGEPRFAREYRTLIDAHRFHERMQTYLANRLELNYSDEELAMLSFEPLFRYETDPALLDWYRRALAQWWENTRREDNPLWIYIYARAHPDRAPLDRAAHTLRRIPLDLITWTTRGSHRRDVTHAPERDRFGRLELVDLLPPDERRVMKWNGNPFQADGGNDGAGEDDGAFFLLPYWMGRHYGYLRD